MSVGNSSLTGIPKTQAPPPVTKVASQGQQNQSNASARSATLGSANAPANAPAAPAVATGVAISGTPVAAPTGGTTAPVGRGPVAAAGNQVSQTATAMAQASMGNPAVLAAMFGAAVNTTKTRAVKSSGDAKEDSGDVEMETESEMQPDALQDSDQEQGAGEITQAGSASGPST